jgi:hypothetical protein
MLRKIGPIAEVASATNHRQVDAGAAAVDLDREDVGVDRPSAGVVLDRLLVQDARQRADLVPDLGRLLELQRVGARHHLRLQRVHQLLLLALQEALGVGDVARVVLGRDVVDAGARAALDLVQQARPRPVGEHRVLAGAQVEHLLDQLDRVLHRPGGRKRAEVAVLLVDRAAVVGDARKAMRLDLEIGIALVVDEADVEARRQRLDQVVLEQQRLGFGAHHRRLHAADPDHHVAGPDRAFAAGVALGEVARDALLEVACLADVEHVVGSIEEAIDAGQIRQRGDLGEEALARHGAIVFARNIDLRLAHRRRLCRACECPRAARGDCDRRERSSAAGACRLDNRPHAVGPLLPGRRQLRRHRRRLAPRRRSRQPWRVGPARGRRWERAGLDGA